MDTKIIWESEVVKWFLLQTSNSK